MALLKPKSATELKRIIRRGGGLNVLAFCVLIPLSYGLAVVSPFGLHQSQEIAVLQGLAERVRVLSPTQADALHRYLAGDSPLAKPVVSVVAYALPLLVSTGVFLALALAIRRSSTLIDGGALSLLFRWAVGFALVNVLVYPIFTQDFWLSVAWGRMILNGDNPYYQLFTPEAIVGTPLLDFPIRMTYGPLWAILSAFLVFLSHRNVVLEFLCFKLFLAASWILCLLLVRRTLADAAPVERALALCLFGWLPISFHVTVGEGHDDILMVLFLLLWMYLALRQRHWISPLALTASVLTKYVTAPIFAVELVSAWRHKRLGGRYLLGLVVCAVVVVGVFGVFWRNWAFFSPVVEMQDRNFLTPAHAVFSLATYFHLRIPRGLASFSFVVLFAAVVACYATRYHRDPGFPQLAELALAVQCTVLFAGVGHIWPWFILWVVAPAAVAIRSNLLLIVVPAAILGPFLHLYWLVAPGWRKLHYASVFFYALVAVGGLILRRMSILPRGEFH